MDAHIYPPTVNITVTLPPQWYGPYIDYTVAQQASVRDGAAEPGYAQWLERDQNATPQSQAAARNPVGSENTMSEFEARSPQRGYSYTLGKQY